MERRRRFLTNQLFYGILLLKRTPKHNRRYAL
ncbi:MAG: hypothetical protein HFF58_03515 [Lawsonibacter sp.]|nr:hypothetical protein [Lawsonibacter sp.]